MNILRIRWYRLLQTDPMVVF